MGTEVLRPQDCLIERIRVPTAVFSRRMDYANYCNYYSNHVRKPATPPERPDRRKRVFARSSQPVVADALFLKRSSADDSRMTKSSGLAMEKVTILRRGESLNSNLKSKALKKNGDDLPNQIRVADLRSDVYAGSAFAVSPSPSALPLPSFGNKRQPAAVVVHDSATRDLRRLLRID